MLRLLTTGLALGLGIGVGFVFGPRITNSTDNERQRLLGKCSTKLAPAAQFQLVTKMVVTTQNGQKTIIENQPIQKVNFGVAAV